MNLFPMNSAYIKNLLPYNTATPASIIIRPMQKNDVDLIMEMHDRLSTNSLYMRYHTPRNPTREEIEKICRLNGTYGRVVVAALPGLKSKIVGMAYYVVTSHDTAETAFLVEDLYQGQGIGRRMMEHLKRLAIAQGVCYFDADVLPSNERMFYLLHKSGNIVQNRLEYGTRELRLELCPVSE